MLRPLLQVGRSDAVPRPSTHRSGARGRAGLPQHGLRPARSHRERGLTQGKAGLCESARVAVEAPVLSQPTVREGAGPQSGGPGSAHAWPPGPRWMEKDAPAQQGKALISWDQRLLLAVLLSDILAVEDLL